jgi:hypothetical protein
MRHSICRRVLEVTAIAVLLAVACRSATLAGSNDAPADVKVSKYAPAEDLTNQLNSIAGRLDGLLANPNEFDEARKSRIAKEADVAAVIALGLGFSDQEHPLKKSASSILASAQALANAEDYPAAKQALDSLKAAAAGKPAPASAVRSLRWEPVAPLGLLMKEVPIIDASLKRSIQGERLKTQTKASAGAAATLAVIAEEAATDHDAVKNPADIPKWEQFCSEMRDAAGSVDQAIHAGDAERVEAAMARLAKSCERCHRSFRK